MGKRYSESHEIAYYECDTTQHLTIPMMLSMAIKVSESQSAVLGRDQEFVRQFGVTWVITQYEIHISRLPKSGEKVSVQTEAKSYNKYFCYRDFWIFDEQGEECVHIESTFVLMNLTTRKLSSVQLEIIEPYESEKITKIKRSEKLLALNEPESSMYRVRYSDIDTNKHVNNAKYFEWLLDVLGFDFLSNHEISRAIIKFDKEISYGNQIESHYEWEPDTLISKHQIWVDQQVCASAQIEWRERKND